MTVKERLLCMMGRHDHVEVGNVGMVLHDRHRLYVHLCQRCGQYGTSGGDSMRKVWRNTRNWSWWGSKDE